MSSELRQIARETSSSWELIAEASKFENKDVFEMLLNFYHGREGNTLEQRYQSCPFSHFQTIFQEKSIRSLFKQSHGKHYQFVPSTTTPSTESKSKSSKQNKVQEIKDKKIIKDFNVALPTAITGDFGRFSIIELIYLNYISVIKKAFKNENANHFINAILSLRDAFDYFMTNENYSTLTHPLTNSLVQSVLTYYEQEFPWSTFFNVYTKYLISNHFSQTYQKASKPFPEQRDLFTLLKQQRGPSVIGHQRLYILPWGVGCGKTACVAPLSYIFDHHHHMPTFYCVPLGPIRDQTASYLYRCGTPFTYIFQTGEDTFYLDPSYHCKNEKDPHLFIVETSFMRYYLQYWESCKELFLGEDEDDLSTIDISDNLPNVTTKIHRDYLHINLKDHRGRTTNKIKPSIWKPKFALILDEPCDNDPHLSFILQHLPETSVILSATSCHLITDEVRQQYQMNHPEGNIMTIEPQTIGVSTTLIGYWLENHPILTPFSNVSSRVEFKQRIDQIEQSILWRRFLSPTVLVNWIKTVKKQLPEGITLNYSFDLLTISYDQISKRILDWAKLIYQSMLQDEWYVQVFQFGNNNMKSREEMIHDIFQNESFKYTGGCIIGMPNLSTFYEDTQFLLTSVPSVDVIKQTISKGKREFYQKYNEIMNATYTRETLSMKDYKLHELQNTLVKKIPIDPSLVVNTPEYIIRCSHELYKSYDGYLRFTTLHSLQEEGELKVNDPEAWNLFVEEINGVSEDVMRTKWIGVSSILDNKEFYMKSIYDSDRGMISFLGVNELGAYGLNLKISHAILFNDEVSPLPKSTCLQLAGRVGRIGQESTGYVYLTTPSLFQTLFV